MPPDNEIWYTTDTQTAFYTPLQKYFDAAIVSNTYNDGIGVIKFSTALTEIYDGTYNQAPFYNSVAGIPQLTSVLFPSKLNRIGESTFEGQNKISKILIPSSISQIGAYALYVNPTEIIYTGTKD